MGEITIRQPQAAAQRSAVAHLARVQEEEMKRDARLMSGILLISVPTIQYGDYFLLRLFSGQMQGMKPSPLQISFFRAGHAHGGMLVILSLICQIFVEYAALGPFASLVRIGVLSFGGVHAGSPK